MVVYTKGRFLTRNHIWFENIKDVKEMRCGLKKCDEIIIHGNPGIPTGKGICAHAQLSLITDLKRDENNIVKRMTKTIRNEISRAERESVECKFCDPDDIMSDKTLLYDFSKIYEKMYASKQMENQHLSINELIGYAQAGRLLISIAYVDRVPVVYHSYVFDEQNCRLLHSCSDFRAGDAATRNAIGRANKYLHWKDMLFFKRRGVLQYDWGGIASFEEPNGIDAFKIAFGGEQISYYNVKIAQSIRLKLFRIWGGRQE